MAGVGNQDLVRRQAKPCCQAGNRPRLGCGLGKLRCFGKEIPICKRHEAHVLRAPIGLPCKEKGLLSLMEQKAVGVRDGFRTRDHRHHKPVLYH